MKKKILIGFIMITLLMVSGCDLFKCKSDADCDDGDPCTSEECQDGICVIGDSLAVGSDECPETQHCYGTCVVDDDCSPKDVCVCNAGSCAKRSSTS